MTQILASWTKTIRPSARKEALDSVGADGDSVSGQAVDGPVRLTGLPLPFQAYRSEV